MPNCQGNFQQACFHRYMIYKYINIIEKNAMEKILITLPDQLANRLRATIPSGQRSKIITHLIEKEIQHREKNCMNALLLLKKTKLYAKKWLNGIQLHAME